MWPVQVNEYPVLCGNEDFLTVMPKFNNGCNLMNINVKVKLTGQCGLCGQCVSSHSANKIFQLRQKN